MTESGNDALNWRKSSYSGGTGGNCVEVATLPDGGRAVRDSKQQGGPVLRFTPAEWAAFVAGINDGEFDS
ncbi:DUF397 domain-containing protein [Frankia sp. CcI156]|uniref:DUF397 domain-containing protein n=1 Tax=Frankia TaxID=1854 RepID=UPI0003CFFFA3|nr:MULTISPECIES: DUF397 domain-containing protein [Frankia]ETA02150.1 hypothetical protein CcI6DRAFT_02325 [Frankia sp. CcI6]KFB05967.1 protein of unknown function (DUF397) [Frankia sp. Allo2]OAA28910.1 protein of unknown function (DUF397) [Frankia casuarinae]OHV48202.1 DUF397 domain-containing protein [Frankia sp. CgIS1]ONH28539.1 DUF397 domain-containing protein [Frankia sp. CcI156]